MHDLLRSFGRKKNTPQRAIKHIFDEIHLVALEKFVIKQIAVKLYGDFLDNAF